LSGYLNATQRYSRKRYRAYVGKQGRIYNSQLTIWATTSYGWAYSEDTVGQRESPNGLYLEKFDLVKGTISGHFYSDDPIFEDYPYSGQPGPGHQGLPALPSATTAITQVMAKSNPSRPTVSLPNEIAELKELPKNILEALNGARKRAPPRSSRNENHVAWFNFGVLPIVGDIMHLLAFSKELDARMKVLERLHSKGSSRGYTVIATDVIGSSVHEDYQTFFVQINGTTYRTTKRKAWATCLWLPDVPLGISPNNQNYRDQAALAIHGWQADPYSILSDAWEFMPWSWFLDYFGNVGDYLNSQRNSVGAHATNGCYMVHTVTDTRHDVVQGRDFLRQSAHGVYDTKERIANPASLDAHLPFLSAGQLLTLAGIAANYSGGTRKGSFNS
jgi:hypothetical protein